MRGWGHFNPSTVTVGNICTCTYKATACMVQYGTGTVQTKLNNVYKSINTQTVSSANTTNLPNHNVSTVPTLQSFIMTVSIVLSPYYFDLPSSRRG